MMVRRVVTCACGQIRSMDAGTWVAKGRTCHSPEQCSRAPLDAELIYTGRGISPPASDLLKGLEVFVDESNGPPNSVTIRVAAAVDVNDLLRRYEVDIAAKMLRDLAASVDFPTMEEQRKRERLEHDA